MVFDCTNNFNSIQSLQDDDDLLHREMSEIFRSSSESPSRTVSTLKIPFPYQSDLTEENGCEIKRKCLEIYLIRKFQSPKMLKSFKIPRINKKFVSIRDNFQLQKCQEKLE